VLLELSVSSALRTLLLHLLGLLGTTPGNFGELLGTLLGTLVCSGEATKMVELKNLPREETLRKLVLGHLTTAWQ